ncbi:MAG: carbohydrate kinase [Lachnospiraceae bacterium]|jgi:fructokinase|nr:carbohydrate kinase [Lachnospiraceae bacterium]MEE3460548.1 carbohydrate kinase [Lachnospiraceae bacterium]
MSNYDVVALGELLIDFTMNGTSSQGNPLFEANPGGAPCNVLSELAKLGHNVAFIGKVGADMFGDQLENAIREVGIETSGLVRDEKVHTTLAFVHTFPDGDRDFSFYRNPGADMMLTADEVDTDMIENAKIFHFGTLSMTDDTVREATKKAVDTAKKAGKIVSFDPNIREPLWSSMDLCRKQIEYGLTKCDILKISDNEIQWFTGEDDFDKGIAAIKREYDIPLILLSAGKTGSYAYTGDTKVFGPAFPKEHVIETTGAGDTFMAGVLNYVLENGWKTYSEKELESMLTWANAGASIITQRRGALRVMPEREEILEIIKDGRVK